MIHITDQPLSFEQARQAVSDPAHGAIVLMEGRTRDHNGGRRVVRLEYELYPEMVTVELQRIHSEILTAHAVGKMAFLVRSGAVPVGEPSVIVAAGAAHRAPAFAACRQAIDDLKRRAPIWKREVFEDGQEWVGQQEGTP